ncbi:hypothetical protein BC940DRAFT_292243 [Gongronella butleri]|nr:hypothetical protein BC940DRAFT_292243 [Gongronella butleri]
MVQMLQNGESGSKVSLELGVSLNRIRAARETYKIPIPEAFNCPPVTEQQKQEIKRLLETNHTNTYAAKACNVSLQVVAKIRKENNIPGQPCSRRLDESTKEEIIKLLLTRTPSSTIMKQFGICAATLHEIRKQNNIPVTGPGRPISDEMGKAITRLLEQGKTIREIVAITGVTDATVTRRRRWRFGDPPSKFYPPDKVEKIKRLLADGLYPRAVAEKVGISYSGIYGFIKSHNLKVNWESPLAAKKRGPQRNPYRKKLAAQETTRATNAHDTQKSHNDINFLDAIPFVVLI